MALPPDQWDDKDPDELDVFGINWEDEIGDNDPILTSTWEITGPDDALTIAVSPSPSISGTKTLVWLEGGTVKAKYGVTNTITTQSGRRLQQTAKLKIKER